MTARTRRPVADYICQKALIFNERLRMLTKHLPLVMYYGWYYKGFFRLCVDKASVVEVIHDQVFGDRGRRYSEDHGHQVYAMKRRGHLVTIHWARNDRLTDDCAIYTGTSLHALWPDDEPVPKGSS